MRGVVARARAVRPRSVVLVALVALFALTGAGRAFALAKKLSVEDMSAKAARVVVGRVENVSSYEADLPGDPTGPRHVVLTDVTFHVSKTLKGKADRTLTVTVLGGEAGGITMTVDESPRLMKGRAYVLFLGANGHVVGGAQGAMEIVGARVPAASQTLALVEDRVTGRAAAARAPDAKTLKRGKAPRRPVKPKADGWTPRPSTLIRTGAPRRLELLSEGFESGMGDFATDGDPTWAPSDAQAASGGYSAYCAGTSADAPPYPDEMFATMSTQSFDLSGVSAGTVAFELWLDAEEGYDWLSVVVSDGVDEAWVSWTGQSSGFEHLEVDLTDVDGTDFTGRENVTVSFVFESDDSYNAEGAYVDDVAITTGGGGGGGGDQPVIESIDPPKASAGTGTKVTIAGTDFGTAAGSGGVAFFYRIQSGTLYPIWADIVSWSDTSIVCEVPAHVVQQPFPYNGSAGSGPVFVLTDGGALSEGYDFEVSFGLLPEKWREGTQCDLLLNAQCNEGWNATHALDDAMREWNNVCAFDLVNAGPTTIRAGARDGKSTVTFCPSSVDPWLEPDTLAYSISYQDADGYTIEADLVYNDDHPWGDSRPGALDVQSITAHELGHHMGLADLYGIPDGDKTMYGFGSPSEVRRHLTPDDRDGAVWLYDAAPTVDREFETIAGANRYLTAIAASQESYPQGAPCVIITTARNWPDALGGAPLAGLLEGPILLTDPASLPQSVRGEIQRLGASQAIILGSSAAVSTNVESQLDAMLGGANVGRIGGASRYETADRIAQGVVNVQQGGYGGIAFVATGRNFPDALAASPIAHKNGWPIFLTDPNGLSAGTKAAIQGLGVRTVLILGSEAAVPAGVANELQGIVGAGNVARIAGANRYQTAVAVATFGTQVGLSWDGLALATGANFPDALAGGALQGRMRSVLLLTPTAGLDPATQQCIQQHSGDIFGAYYLGSDSVVSPNVKQQVESILD